MVGGAMDGGRWRVARTASSNPTSASTSRQACRDMGVGKSVGKLRAIRNNQANSRYYGGHPFRHIILNMLLFFDFSEFTP
jgi:hypothetical protein